MCWMAARTGRGALREAVSAVREHERSNGHSWGWAAVVDGQLVVERGTGLVPRRPLPESRAAVAHTRFATRGEVNEANAHPFPIERDGETVAALAHNGTWLGAPDVPGWSDIRVMADIMETEVRSGSSVREALEALGETTGETLLVIECTGAVHVHPGRFGIDRVDGGFASSACGGLEGPVRTVEPEAPGVVADD